MVVGVDLGLEMDIGVTVGRRDAKAGMQIERARTEKELFADDHEDSDKENLPLNALEFKHIKSDIGKGKRFFHDDDNLDFTTLMQERPSLHKQHTLPQLPRKIPQNRQPMKIADLMSILGGSEGNSHATPSLNSVDITDSNFDARTVYNPVLKSFYDGDQYKRVRPVEVSRLVEGRLEQSSQPYLIIDCRYSFEYQGGHIKGALNCTNPIKIKELLFDYRSFLGVRPFVRRL